VGRATVGVIVAALAVVGAVAAGVAWMDRMPDTSLTLAIAAALLLLVAAFGIDRKRIGPAWVPRAWRATNVLCVAALLALIGVGTLPSTGNRHPPLRLWCASNLRHIGLAAILYADANGDRLPPSFDTLLLTRDIPPETFTCAASTDAVGTVPLGPGTCSYVWAGAGLTVGAPSNTPIAFEPIAHHGAGGNVLYVDASVSFERPATIANLVHNAVADGRLTQAQADHILAVP
jgi:prepilin-type processing-associated H-X9-DG protein